MAGAFAEFETAMLKERTKAEFDAAREEGRIGVPRVKLTPQQAETRQPPMPHGCSRFTRRPSALGFTRQCPASRMGARCQRGNQAVRSDASEGAKVTSLDLLIFLCRVTSGTLSTMLVGGDSLVSATLLFLVYAFTLPAG